MSNTQNEIFSYLNDVDSKVYTFAPDPDRPDKVEYRFYVEAWDIDSAFIRFINAESEIIPAPGPFQLFRSEAGFDENFSSRVPVRNGEFLIRPTANYTLTYYTEPIWRLDSQRQQAICPLSKRVICVGSK